MGAQPVVVGDFGPRRHGHDKADLVSQLPRHLQPKNRKTTPGLDDFRGLRYSQAGPSFGFKFLVFPRRFAQGCRNSRRVCQIAVSGQMFPTRQKDGREGVFVAERSAHDPRQADEQGTQLTRLAARHVSAHVAMLAQNGITAADLQHATAVLERLERFWFEASSTYRHRG